MFLVFSLGLGLDRFGFKVCFFYSIVDGLDVGVVFGKVIEFFVGLVIYFENGDGIIVYRVGWL